MNHLLIQGHDLPTPDLKTLAKLTATREIVACPPRAFRLLGADPGQQDRVREFCAERAIDWAWVPDARSLSDFGLLAMDMDSTLITIECIDEIADMQGLKPQVAAITEAAMRGELDFAESLRRRVALLAGLPLAALDRVYETRLRLTPGAEMLLSAAQRAGLKTLLVSGGFTFFTERLKTRLGLDETHANTLEVIDGVLTGRLLGNIVDAQAKADRLISMRDRLGLPASATVAIGDGANDLKMLGAAGVGIAFHAKPVVQPQADHALNHVGLDGVLALLGACG